MSKNKRAYAAEQKAAGQIAAFILELLKFKEEEGVTDEEFYRRLYAEDGSSSRRAFIAGAKTVTAARVVPLETPFLKQLFVNEVITIAPTDGRGTIAQAKDVFASGIDSDFTNWNLNHCSSSTQAIPVIVAEQTNDGTFMEIFGSVGNLEKLHFTQHQIINFAQEHRQELRQGGYGTFFPFKKDKTKSIYAPENGFVANVGVYSDGLSVRVDALSSDFVWYAEFCRRFVFPQLTI